MSWRVRLGRYLRQRANFIKTGTIVFGGGMAAFTLWKFGAYGGVGWWLFLIAVSLVGGWLWAFGMWFVLADDFRKISEAEAAAQKPNEGGQQ